MKKYLTEEEIIDIWEYCDPTEWLPDVRRYDGTLFPEFVSFVKEIQNLTFAEALKIKE